MQQNASMTSSHSVHSPASARREISAALSFSAGRSVWSARAR